MNKPKLYAGYAYTVFHSPDDGGYYGDIFTLDGIDVTTTDVFKFEGVAESATRRTIDLLNDQPKGDPFTCGYCGNRIDVADLTLPHRLEEPGIVFDTDQCENEYIDENHGAVSQ